MKKRKKEILVYGNFCFKKWNGGGEATKTRNILSVLRKRFGDREVDYFNMEAWKIHPLSLLIKFGFAIKKYKNIVAIPGPNNARFIIPFLARRKRKYHYSLFLPVVGGVLFDDLRKSPRLLKQAEQIDGIYPETKILETRLQSLGLHSVHYSPVFSMRCPLPLSAIETSTKALVGKPMCFCTFSRVMKEKGITIAINSVVLANKSLPKEKQIHLTVFGGVSKEYSSEFFSLISDNKDCVEYGGFLPDESVIDRLSNFYCLLFPTFYYGEGFPATLVECFMAGLPVIASKWRYNEEIVESKKNGLIVPIEEDPTKQFTEAVLYAANHQEEFLSYRVNCFNKSKNFYPDKALEPLLNDLSQNIKRDD